MMEMLTKKVGSIRIIVGKIQLQKGVLDDIHVEEFGSERRNWSRKPKKSKKMLIITVIVMRTTRGRWLKHKKKILYETENF